MSGDDRSREQLLDEVRQLRQRLGEAEQRETALARREGLYRAAIEAAGAVPYARNYLTGTFDYVGPGIRALLGHAPEAFTVAVWNASVLEVFPFGQTTDLSARDASNWLRAQEGPGWWADLRVRTAAGEERWLTNAAVKLHDERGQLVGSLGLWQDVTERKRAEEALRGSEGRLRLLAHAVQSTTDFIALTDLDGRFLFVNRAFLETYGFTEGEVLGKTPRELAAPGELPPLVQDLLAATRRGGWKGELPVRRKDGSPLPIALCTSVVRDEHGVAVGLVGVGRDVGERQRLEEQLRQAQKLEAVGRLAGGVAHDFNNLLTVILGCAEVLRGGLGPGAPAHELLEGIRNAGERAAALVRQLLAYSRQQMLVPRVLDLNALVGDMERLLRPVLGTDIALVTRLEAPLGRVRADAVQLEQAVLNLVVNAREAMPRGGELTLRTADVCLDEGWRHGDPDFRPGPYVLLAVGDTGSGMTEAVRARLFEPFFTTKELGKGTGLGLATVYGIIKQSGGHVEVESAPGRGSEFRLYLPRVEDGTPAA